MKFRDLKAQRDDMKARYRAAIVERSRAETMPERRAELRPVIACLGKGLTAIKKEIAARRKIHAARSLAPIGRAQ